MTAAAPAVRARRWPAGLAWGLWGLVVAGLGAFAWFDQLVRQAGRPDLAVAGPDVLPPVLGRWGWPRSGRWWPAAVPGIRSAG